LTADVFRIVCSLIYYSIYYLVVNYNIIKCKITIVLNKTHLLSSLSFVILTKLTFSNDNKISSCTLQIKEDKNFIIIMMMMLGDNNEYDNY
jgi:hypothetical protein